MNCFICKSELKMAKKMRQNNYLSASCPQCKWQHSFWTKDNTLSWISKRTSINGSVWNITYRPDKDFTRYVKVEKHTRQEIVEGLVKREEHELSGLVMPERFLNLIAFL